MQAIQYATDTWKVDIIVMSFGFEEEQQSIRDAIEHAAREGVLIFAAASNDGHNNAYGAAWPARAKEVICVHSGTVYGRPSEYTPGPRDGQRIMVLGEYVKSAWPEQIPDTSGGYKYMSGTSCAAPIAAGIAATVLYYSRSFLEPADWKKVHRTDCMRRIFERMKDNSENYWWILPWKLFSEDEELWIRTEIKRALRY